MPGLNAALEMEGDYTVVVLANLDPPAAEKVAEHVRSLLPGGGGSAAAEALTGRPPLAGAGNGPPPAAF